MIIGVLDSGIGGLNILAALIKKRAGDDYLYLADNANLPYGDKDVDALREIAMRGVTKLTSRGANVIVFGCNTLSVSALDHVRKRVTPPVFGLIPRPDLLCGRSLMMTTPTTAMHLPELNCETALLTPSRLAALIDRDYPDLREITRYLSPLLVPYEEYESVFLGCSHYLYIRELIHTLLPHAKVLDGVRNLASVIHAVLPEGRHRASSVDFLFTGENETDRYCRLLQSLL